jgi:hypothetical protein
MQSHSPHPARKVETVNFRVDPALKAAFTEAAAAEDKPAGQLLRDFMRDYVARRRRRAFAAEAARQSRVLAAAAADPGSEEAAVLRELEGPLADLDDEWT